ncbi:hypothetical protein [Paenibacillus flagellatus]|nr:hypothetical protein [Paenibacillus flagellatus]
MRGTARKGGRSDGRAGAMARAICLLLAVAVTLGGPVLGASPARAEANAEEMPGVVTYDFENFAVGPLNGQLGWTNASPEVTVTDQVYAVSGTKTVRIADNDKTKALGARVTFPAVGRGSVEWWAKADTADRLVMLLESAGPQGTKPVEWIGFLANRKIEYYDGATRVNTSETYEPGKWYRFHLDFDMAAGRKSIAVFDGDDLLLLRKDTAVRDATVTSVNVFRLATISTGLGTFYVDDVRIRDAELAPPGSLSGVTAHPDSVSVQVGQSRQVHLIGHYTNGDVRMMESNEASFVSDQPGVATAEGGSVTGVSPGSAVVTASVYGGLQAAIDVNVYDANDVPPYRDLALRPLQRTTAVQGLSVVVPAGAEWEALGNDIAAKLQARWNVQASVVAPERSKFRDGWSGNALLLGSLGNNEQLARLYGMRMSYADAVYPGDGGYQLQTVIDPFGLGGNSVVVGASDLAGARAGVAKLLEKLDAQTEPVIPWLAEAVLSKQAASYLPFDGKPTPADVAAALQSVETWLSRLKPTTGNEADADALLYVFNRLKLYGEGYLLTADPGLGDIYRKLAKGYANFVNRYPAEAKGQLNARANMWTDGDKAIQLWSTLEASPLFTARERKQIVSAFALTYEANAQDGYLVGAAATGPRWNHQIFPALSLIAGSDYFGKYYALPEAPGWRQLGERIFTGNTSYISLDEGSDYLMHVPMTNIDYAMATGNLDFLTRSLRPSADLNALMIDNIGTMAGGGDTYPFGYSNAYSWGHSQVMNAASWFYGDPVYQYLLERTRNGPFPGQRMSDLDYPIHRYAALKPEAGGEPPEGAYPKVQAYPVEPGIYDDLRGPGQEPLDVALADTFHKMTFREGFGADDSYLIVDGFSAGAHGHQDGNAILNYTADGRLFLVDRDYMENTPEHHSGLVVVKDGEQEKKPPLAKLEWAADVGGIALSRSVVPNYNGTDWRRSIVSPNGDFYIIYDDVKVNETGNYLLKNQWQTLGTPTVNGGRYEAEQQGVTMAIDSLDRSRLLTQDRYGHFRKYWKSDYPYPYADRETVLSEVLEEQRYAAGDTAAFINVLSSRKEDEPALHARRLNETTVEIKQEGERWLAVHAPLDTPDVASDGKLHLLGEGRLLAAEATNVRIGSETLRFDEPVLFAMNTANGEWEAYSLRKDRVRYDERGEPVREGALEAGAVPWSRQAEQRLGKALKEKEHPGTWAKAQPDRPGVHPDWEPVYAFPEQVTAAGWGDLDGDGREELLLGGIGGNVQAIDETGAVRWAFAAAGRVNEVTVQTVNGEPVVFVATENWYVHALDAAGGEKWRYEFPHTGEHRERKGNLLGITNVRVAHVNGTDQEPWIMVGTQFRYIYGLDPEGRLKYEDLLYFYGIEDMAFADMDGDGKDEGIYALEYAYYAYWDDKQVTRGGSGGGPGWKVATVLPGGNGGTLPAIALGTKQNEVRLVAYAGKPQELWKRNVGGEVNDVRSGDYDGDGVAEILAGSDGFQLYALRPDGTVRFRTALEERVLHVDGSAGDGGARYWAAADHGLLAELSAEGEVVSRVRFAHDIAAFRGGATEARPWVVLADGEVMRYRD